MTFAQFFKGFPLSEILIVSIIICVTLVLFLDDILNWFGNNARSVNRNIVFRGYDLDSPETWKFKFSKAKGKSQSPINIKPSCSMVIPSGTYKPLVFSKQYFSLPASLTLLNDGYGVLLGTCFENEYPTISGGPLKHRYRFNLAQFKWGPTNYEGSEHTLNSKRYAMELQLMHIRGEKMYENLDCAVQNKAVLFISYFFEVIAHDNPYLVPITNALQYIRCPNTSTTTNPFPLCWLFHPFKFKYYFYQGSITCPPCTEGVDWIIQPEPLSISANQLNCFRSLSAIDGMMLQNTRPVQKINNRTIYFYE